MLKVPKFKKTCDRMHVLLFLFFYWLYVLKPKEVIGCSKNTSQEKVI